ncbi:hypothetical protein [Microbacterium sp. p3-SID336]|nr:hypothetical protein [Microbacterium sp. p3-SID336]MCT1476511.1 hypothetical protein [Microbacterium sp. p3-SID336]
MTYLVPTPDAGLTDPSHSWRHPDGTITPASDDDIARLVETDDERTLG